MRSSRDAPAVQRELFYDVPEMCATDINGMRRALYELFAADERRFCKQMIYFITSIRKRNRGCEGQAFPPDTLHHKLRRLSGAPPLPGCAPAPSGAGRPRACSGAALRLYLCAAACTEPPSTLPDARTPPPLPSCPPRRLPDARARQGGA